MKANCWPSCATVQCNRLSQWGLLDRVDIRPEPLICLICVVVRQPSTFTGIKLEAVCASLLLQVYQALCPPSCSLSVGEIKEASLVWIPPMDELCCAWAVLWGWWEQISLHGMIWYSYIATVNLKLKAHTKSIASKFYYQEKKLILLISQLRIYIWGPKKNMELFGLSRGHAHLGKETMLISIGEGWTIAVDEGSASPSFSEALCWISVGGPPPPFVLNFYPCPI